MKAKIISPALFLITHVFLFGSTFTAKASPSDPPQCSPANAKPITFRDVEAYEDSGKRECVKITGYILGSALHKNRAVALSKKEPDWQTIGLWDYNKGEAGAIAARSIKPRKATVIGFLEDCGSRNWPQYCHYVGGLIIDAADVKFHK